jgi:hypothetical protein
MDLVDIRIYESMDIFSRWCVAVSNMRRCSILVWYSYDICWNRQLSFTQKIIFFICFNVLKKLNMYWNNVINEELKILILIRIFLIFLNKKLINQIKFYHIYSGVGVLCFLHYWCRSVRVVSRYPYQNPCFIVFADISGNVTPRLIVLWSLSFI